MSIRPGEPRGGPVAVAVAGATFRYAGAGRPAIRDVAFELDPGSCLLVLGPSGSGKSTLALALAGLVPGEFDGEWQGRVLIDGHDVAGGGSAARGGRLGLLFQDPDRQLVMERAEDDVAFGLENRGWDPAAMHRRVPEALAEAGLAGFERRRPGHLSGGEQQRLALAGVLAPYPGLLVLDEPTANLDPEGAAALMTRIAAIRHRRESTIVLVEHDVDAAWGLADLVLALGPDGAPIALGPPADVLARHAAAIRAAGAWLPGDRPSGGGGVGPASGSSAPPVGQPVVTAEGVSYGYQRGRPVVIDATLAIGAGERVALVGRNGSGKSTLGRLLVGLLRPATGAIRLDGLDPAGLAAPALARRAGYAFQDPERQFLATTVAEEVRLGLRPDELAGVDELMDRLRLSLAVFGDRSPYRLSGGEQRRLSLACILSRRPGLLVLDEPTFGQDRRGVEGLLEILRERVVAGTAVLAATHDRRFVAAFANRLLTMDDGVVTAGRPSAEPGGRPR